VQVKASAEAFREQILHGPIIRTLLWLAWPLIVANIVNISYNLIDAFWLGKLGKEAFGAPTVCWPMIMLFYSIGMGYTAAGIALISQYFGAGDKRMAEICAGHLLFFSLIIALMMSTIGYVSAPHILSAMRVPPDIYPLAVKYVSVIFMGIPFVFVGFAFNAIANAIGDTRTPTILNITSATVNTILDPFMIFGLAGFPKMGVIGAALATIISRSIISIVGTYLLLKGFRGIRIHLEYLKVSRWWLRKIFSIGTPLAIQQSSNALGFTIMTSIVSRFGSTVVAAYGIAIRIIDVMQAFTWGINRALVTMIGQNIGAEQYERTRNIAWRALVLIVSILVIGSIIIFLFRYSIISVFIDDVSVLNEGSLLIQVFTFSIPFFGLFFVSGAIANGSGHTKIFAAISVIRLWGLRILLSILLAFMLNLGSLGIWIAMSISNIVAGVISLAWVLRGSWLKRVIDITT